MKKQKLPNDLIKNICMINSTSGLFQCMDECANNPEFNFENPFDKKVYSFSINDWLDMHFIITKETSTPAFPVYLDISTCTDIKQLIYQLLNSKEDTIDYTILTLSFWKRASKEVVKEYGLFGDDPVFYQGLKVTRWFVPNIKNYQIPTDEMINSVKRI